MQTLSKDSIQDRKTRKVMLEWLQHGRTHEEILDMIETAVTRGFHGGFEKGFRDGFNSAKDKKSWFFNKTKEK